MSLLSQARWQNRIAVSAFIVSGATMLAGLVMASLNRSRSQIDPAATRGKPMLVPMVSDESAGISTALRF